MRNRKLVILGMVCALAAMPVMTFGAAPSRYMHSGSDRDSGSSSSAGSYNGPISRVIVAGTNQVLNATQTIVFGDGTTLTGASVAYMNGNSDVLGVLTAGTNANNEVIAADKDGNAVVGDTIIKVGKSQDGSDKNNLNQSAQDVVKRIEETKSMSDIMPETAGYTAQRGMYISLEKNGAVSNEAKIVPVKWTGAPAQKENMMAVCIRPDGTRELLEIVSVQNGVFNVRMTGTGYIVLLTK